jgi:hypothetical protein
MTINISELCSDKREVPEAELFYRSLVRQALSDTSEVGSNNFVDVIARYTYLVQKLPKPYFEDEQ